MPPILIEKQLEICEGCKNKRRDGCPLHDYMIRNNADYLQYWKESTIPEILEGVKRFKKSVCPFMAYTAYCGETYIFDGDVKLHEGGKK